MSWVHEIGGGAPNDKTASTSWAAILGTPNVPLNRIVVVIAVLATDNITTTDGNTNDHQSCATSGIGDWSKGVVPIKAREFTNGQAAAGGGATVSIWYAVVGKYNSNANLGTWTFRFSGSITAKGLTYQTFSIDEEGVVVDPQAGDLANDAADAGSIALSGLENKEHLFIRAQAIERAQGGTWTASTNYTTFASGGGGPAAGQAATNIEAVGEYRIFTGTASTSDPTSTAVDQAGTHIALNEQRVAYANSPSAALAPF